MEKERKCWLPVSSPFTMMFSKGFLLRVVVSLKSLDCNVKGIKNTPLHIHVYIPNKSENATHIF